MQHTQEVASHPHARGGRRVPNSDRARTRSRDNISRDHNSRGNTRVGRGRGHEPQQWQARSREPRRWQTRDREAAPSGASRSHSQSNTRFSRFGGRNHNFVRNNANSPHAFTRPHLDNAPDGRFLPDIRVPQSDGHTQADLTSHCVGDNSSHQLNRGRDHTKFPRRGRAGRGRGRRFNKGKRNVKIRRLYLKLERGGENNTDDEGKVQQESDQKPSKPTGTEHSSSGQRENVASETEKLHTENESLKVLSPEAKVLSPEVKVLSFVESKSHPSSLTLTQNPRTDFVETQSKQAHKTRTGNEQPAAATAKRSTHEPIPNQRQPQTVYFV